MNAPLITVLIDTYNYGNFVQQAIESVLEQDFPPGQVEILLVDDGSTDDTVDRVKKYGSDIHYFYKPNGGQASAFNFGIQRARGEIVAFLDADDYWLPGKLRRVVEEFGKNPTLGMVYHRLREFDAATGEIRDAPFAAVSGSIASSRVLALAFNATATSSLAFRRSVLEQLVPIPEGIRIQADGYIETLATFLAPVVGIDEPLAVYRIHGNNLYFQQHGVMNVETQNRRVNTLQALVEGMRAWFRSRGYDTNQPVVRATLQKWFLLLEREKFKLSSPGRIRFFWHLLATHRNNYPLMTWRLRVINCVNAVGSIVVGYERFHVLDDGWEKLTRWIRGWSPKRSRSPQSLAVEGDVLVKGSQKKSG
jgi:glycosyltransferase involved in cell wall biosynthesis